MTRKATLRPITSVKLMSLLGINLALFHTIGFLEVLALISAHLLQGL